MENDNILLVDAYSQIFRGYYAIRYLTNSRQEPTNAIFAFAKLLLRLHREYPAAYGAFLFDRGKPAFRLAIAPEYKANRAPMPDDLRAQIPCIEELADAFGWPRFVYEGYEADDLIAAMTEEFKGRDISIISSDKDLAQLIDEQVRMLVPDNKSGGFAVRGAAEVVDKFSVKPEQIVDYLALIGDASDNIPGVPGVGPKTAAKLICEHNSIESMLAAPEQIANQNLRDKIIGNSDVLKKNIELITLKKEIPGKPWSGLDELTRHEPDWRRIRDICEAMELRSILKELPETDEIQDMFDAESTIGQPEPPTVAKSPENKGKYAPDMFGDL